MRSSECDVETSPPTFVAVFETRGSAYRLFQAIDTEGRTWFQAFDADNHEKVVWVRREEAPKFYVTREGRAPRD